MTHHWRTANSVCQKVETKAAEGNQDHVDVGTPMSYPEAPPAFGSHWNMWDTMDRKLSTSLRELIQAVRKLGMRFGLYYSGGLDWTFRTNHFGIGLTARLTDLSGYLIFATTAVLIVACLDDVQLRDLEALVSASGTPLILSSAAMRSPAQSLPGVALARRDAGNNARVLCLIGDGSLLLAHHRAVKDALAAFSDEWLVVEFDPSTRRFSALQWAEDGDESREALAWRGEPHGRYDLDPPGDQLPDTLGDGGALVVLLLALGEPDLELDPLETTLGVRFECSAGEQGADPQQREVEARRLEIRNSVLQLQGQQAEQQDELERRERREEDRIAVESEEVVVTEQVQDDAPES